MLMEALYVCERELKHFIRMRVQIVSSIVTPIIWLVFFGYSMNLMSSGFGGISILNIVIGGERALFLSLLTSSLNLDPLQSIVVNSLLGISYLDFFYSGVVGVTVMFACIFSGLSIIWDKRFGFLNKLLVAPIPRLSILLGKTMYATIRGVIQGVIILGLSFLIGAKVRTGIIGVLLALFFIFLLSLGLGAFSMSLGIKLADQEALFGIINMITLPLFISSGAFMPVEAMPGWLQLIAYGNPLTYLVDALRLCLLGGPYSVLGYPYSLADIAPRLLKDLTAISVFTGTFLAIGTLLFRKTLK
ncbi:MAG: ABC transporter permease [Candidatus Jordarchaeales archaeon]